MTSIATKKLLSDTLKELMLEKDISKISVSELAKKAGVDRKTFYYHFRDVYALLAWTFETEAIGVVANYDLLTDYRSAISFAIDYLEANEALVSRLARSGGRGDIRRFLHRDLFEVTKHAIRRSFEESGVEHDDDFELFLAEFFTEAFAGVLLRWVSNPSFRDRVKLEKYVSRIFESFNGYLGSVGGWPEE